MMNQTKKILFGSTLALALILTVFMFARTQQTAIPLHTKIQDACNSYGGQYSLQYKECSGISKEQCDSMNGTFNECASACRHGPDVPGQACTMQCVVVCQLQ